jgi:hypothetical protein
MIEDNAFIGLRRTIDISGDGPSNEGPKVVDARNAAVARGIVINGLPIDIDDFRRPWPKFFDPAEIADYYEHCVIGGPGAFLIPVRKRENIGVAVKRKLVTEIAQNTHRLNYPPVIKVTNHTLCTIGEFMWRKTEPLPTVIKPRP